jgi:hypothetical protein
MGAPTVKARIPGKNLHPQFHNIAGLCFDRSPFAVPTVFQATLGFEGSSRAGLAGLLARQQKE